jgi:hypothetical protein
MITYGTEIAVPGGAPENEKTGEGQDYLNRLPMDWEAVDGRYADLVDFFRRLAGIRKSFSALRRGQTREVYKDYGIYCYWRFDRSDAILVLANTSGLAETRKIVLGFNGRSEGLLKDLLGGSQYPFSRDTLTITMAPRTVYLLHLAGGFDFDRLAKSPRTCEFSPVLTRDMISSPFRYVGAEALQSVAIAGDFNGWSATANPMEKTALNEWRASIPLRNGRYRYKLVLDGSTWIADPESPLFESDPYGGKNSIREIGTDAE